MDVLDLLAPLVAAGVPASTVGLWIKAGFLRRGTAGIRDFMPWAPFAAAGMTPEQASAVIVLPPGHPHRKPALRMAASQVVDEPDAGGPRHPSFWPRNDRVLSRCQVST